MSEFIAGQSYSVYVPSGWIFLGTVQLVQGGRVYFRDAVYLEDVANGKSSIGSTALAKTDKEVTECLERCYLLPNGFSVREDSILAASPMLATCKDLIKSEKCFK